MTIIITYAIPSKRFLFALVPAALFSLGTTTRAAEPASVETAVAQLDTATTSGVEQAPAPNQGKSADAKRRKPKPFTSEDIKRAEANKKKLEWWQMPKPPVPQSGSSNGRSHVGH